MIPVAFDYERATSIDDAIAKLGASNGGKLIAGGHSLVPLMKLRLSEPGKLGHNLVAKSARVRSEWPLPVIFSR